MKPGPNPAERRFAAAAIQRKRLFLALSVVGVAVAAVLAGYYGYRRWTDPEYDLGVRLALVVLILLNARQNLRQFRYAGVLQRLMGDEDRSDRPRDRSPRRC